MPFWTYMLQCRDRTLYVGHTDDLDVRLAAHQQGAFAGYTARKLPVTLVWCEQFPTCYEALAAERRIKGWRKEKKLALIRGDWPLVSRLSREKKERPSTSSGRTGEGEATGTASTSSLRTVPEDTCGASTHTVRPEPVEGRPLPLLPHPDLPAPSIRLQAAAQRNGSSLSLRYVMTGELSGMLIPPPAPPTRADGLWHHTCLELFLRVPAERAYYEFNFSPSGRWAAYHLAAYRDGMNHAGIAPPAIDAHRTGARLELRVQLDLAPLEELSPDRPWQAGLSAILEDRARERSFWALVHPPGEPDFHHPACFALELPAPERS